MRAMKFKTARILFLGDVFATAVIQLLKHPFIKWMQYELHSGTKLTPVSYKQPLV